MTMESLPEILFRPGEEKDMGDMEYTARIANGELSTGILVPLTSRIQNGPATAVMGTVPVGKDWYLLKYSFSNLSGQVQLEYPTGTVVADDTVLASGVATASVNAVSGLKLTAGQTITHRLIGGGGDITSINLLILQVDIGTSPKLV